MHLTSIPQDPDCWFRGSRSASNLDEASTSVGLTCGVLQRPPDLPRQSRSPFSPGRESSAPRGRERECLSLARKPPITHSMKSAPTATLGRPGGSIVGASAAVSSSSSADELLHHPSSRVFEFEVAAPPPQRSASGERGDRSLSRPSRLRPGPRTEWSQGSWYVGVQASSTETPRGSRPPPPSTGAVRCTLWRRFFETTASSSVVPGGLVRWGEMPNRAGAILG